MTATKFQSSNSNHKSDVEVQTALLNLESQLANYQAEDGLSLTSLATILTNRAQALAAVPLEPPTGQTLELLVFQLGQEKYGIDVHNVREIYPQQPLTLVPRTPNFVAGIFSARGRILSVIDFAHFLGLPPRQSTELDQPKIIVVTTADSGEEMAQLEVGLLVDEVSDIVTIFEDEVKQHLVTQSRADYVRGITSELLVVLNLNALLNDKHLIVDEEVL